MGKVDEGADGDGGHIEELKAICSKVDVRTEFENDF